MWLHYPDDEQAVTRGDEYLWGRDYAGGAGRRRGATRRSCICRTGDWYDFWTNERQRAAAK